jgi:hypothetical protein
MGFTKVVGIVAVSAIAVMATVGVSSATATSTILCKVNQLVCPAADEYTGHFEMLATNPTLLSSVGDLVCERSTILGNALSLASPLVGHLELIDFTGNCHIGLTSCTITTKALGLVLLLKTGPNVGSLESHGNNVLLNCAGILHCVYGGLFSTTALGYNDATEELATVHTNEVSLPKVSGLLCPERGNWDALYKVLLPHKIYISE